MAKKRQTLGKLKKEVTTAFQLLRRLECVEDSGYGKCCSCDRRVLWDEGDGGHFIPRGVSETLLDERNVHLQCKPCNGWGMTHPACIETYKSYITDLYGADTVQELLDKDRENKTIKRDRVEWVCLLAEFDYRIAFELQRVGGSDKRSRLGLWDDKALYKEEINKLKGD